MPDRTPIPTALVRLPARALLGLIRGYQRFVSPAIPVVFGPNSGCRFYPSCSCYAAEAVSRHGAIIGTGLAAVRIVRCNPLHPGGFDPVPTLGRNRAPSAASSSERAAARPACVRV